MSYFCPEPAEHLSEEQPDPKTHIAHKKTAQKLPKATGLKTPIKTVRYSPFVEMFDLVEKVDFFLEYLQAFFYMQTSQ